MTKTQTTGQSEDLATMTPAELASLADAMICPDGMRTPFNSAPLPKTRRALVTLIVELRQRRADSEAIERAGRWH